ncbi:MAG TPA: hypothetical protein DCS60_02070, partial [Opitutae bacterium]|nr:hypothetical protein [Opitutae bacterium]
YLSPICVIIPTLTSALAFRWSGEPCNLPESLNKRADGTCLEPIFRTHFCIDKRLANGKMH